METIRELLENSVENWKNSTAQTYYHGGKWISRTFGELYNRVAKFAEAMSDLGLKPFKSKIALMLENCPEWTDVYLANACTGITVVPIDPKLRTREVQHILADSQSEIIVISAKLKNLISEIKSFLPNLRKVILIGENKASEGDEHFIDFNSLMEKYRNCVATTFWNSSKPSPSAIASILYTSGTTGTPKGAMLSHLNFCSNAESTLHDVPLKSSDSFMVVLPLFHAYSFMANFIYPLRIGASASFIRGLKTITEDLKILRPTVLMTVPLMAEKMYAKVAPAIEKSFVAKLLIFCKLQKLICRKIIKNMGGRLKMFGIGGAPLPRNVFEGFRKIGFPIIEGYGITECSPGIVYGRIEEYHPGYVGRLIFGMEMRLDSPDENGVGELWVKGPNVSLGYFNNKEATEKSFQDGWFKTGDLCEVEKSGLIAIRGRKKAMIVNREGKNIYAEEVEQIIARDSRIADVIVLGYSISGENGERVGVIVTPNPESFENMSHDSIAKILKDSVQVSCSEIADYKKPRKIKVSQEPLERTSTMKIRRVVYEHSLDE